MFKLLAMLVFAGIIAVTLGQHIIYPTYRPPPTPHIIYPTYRPPPSSGPIIRTARDTHDQEPLWLNQGDIPRAPASGDHPFLPTYIDDIKLDPNTRYARSVDSPSARRSGGSHQTSSGSRDTGATHPGYNRRNARSIRTGFPPSPFNPQPSPFNPLPNPFNPGTNPPYQFPMPRDPIRPYPIYA